MSEQERFLYFIPFVGAFKLRKPNYFHDNPRSQVKFDKLLDKWWHSSYKGLGHLFVTNIKLVWLHRYKSKKLKEKAKFDWGTLFSTIQTQEVHIRGLEDYFIEDLNSDLTQGGNIAVRMADITGCFWESRHYKGLGFKPDTESYLVTETTAKAQETFVFKPASRWSEGWWFERDSIMGVDIDLTPLVQAIYEMRGSR